MLDSLNSTLTRPTIAGFFMRFGKEPRRDELTFDEAVQCLEAELERPMSEKRRIGEDEAESEGVGTPMIISRGGSGGAEVALELEKMDFSGPRVLPSREEPAHHPLGRPVMTPTRQASDSSYDEWEEGEVSGETSSGSASASPASIGEGRGSVPPAPIAGVSAVPAAGVKVKKTRFRRRGLKSSKDKSSTTLAPANDTFERVINVKNCPLCHRPRMNGRAEVDIVTHLAVCASQDWGKVDRMVVGHFVTASEAQRKWYTRVLEKVSGGGYGLGAVCGFHFGLFSHPFEFALACVLTSIFVHRILQILLCRIG
jgi:phosphatidylserine decarboxylase